MKNGWKKLRKESKINLSLKARAPLQKDAFTLLELLVVIGLLGALAMLLLPRLQMQRSQVVEKSLAPAEMMDIRRAFAAFEADCAPTPADWEIIEKYGLEILMEYDAERGWSFPDSFDYQRGKGWRGPYIEQQGTRRVYIDQNGQPLAGSGTTATIPVVHDPYSALPDDEHYYRLIHTVESGKDYLKLVFIGSDGVLGTDDDIERVILTW